MNDYIGIGFDYFPWRSKQRRLYYFLKQYILLFDKVGIVNIEKPLPSSLRFIYDQLYWLEEQGLIFQIKRGDFFSEIAPKINSDDNELINKINDELMDWYVSSFRYNILISKPPRNETAIHEFSFYKLCLRLFCNNYEENKLVRSSPILLNSRFDNMFLKNEKQTVVSMTINKLPLPSDATPWEQIIDYKNDPENHQDLLALRRWIRKISFENLNINEFNEEIEYLMNEYKKHMQFHKMKANFETIETIIKAPLEIVEDIATFRFSKLADPLFSVRKRQMALIEAERTAPGREISYIIKAKKQFE
ncbi:MAG: hypothetical protein NTZ48_07665 [Candidatus Omnitrophica bacterium]|nr:hypothetical protein [Candidatus Omnitrophota bacterium]